jgi:hypothetical protein
MSKIILLEEDFKKRSVEGPMTGAQVGRQDHALCFSETEALVGQSRGNVQSSHRAQVRAADSSWRCRFALKTRSVNKSCCRSSGEDCKPPVTQNSERGQRKRWPELEEAGLHLRLEIFDRDLFLVFSVVKRGAQQARIHNRSGRIPQVQPHERETRRFEFRSCER